MELLRQGGFWETARWRTNAALFRTDWYAKPNGQQFLDPVHHRWKVQEPG